MYACSLVNHYLCIIVPPGIGKTIGAFTIILIKNLKKLNKENENELKKNI